MTSLHYQLMAYKQAQLFSDNIEKLMQCQPILFSNWEDNLPYIQHRSGSVQMSFDTKKIEEVAFRDLKRILESNVLIQKDKDFIQKQRKLANNRRAAKSFRNRAITTDGDLESDLNNLEETKMQLEREKAKLQKEIDNYRVTINTIVS